MRENKIIRFKTISGKTVCAELSENPGYPPELYVYYEETDQNIAIIRQIEALPTIVNRGVPGMEILVWEDPHDDDFTKRLEVAEGEYEE